MPSWREFERFLQHDGWSFVPERSGNDLFFQKRLSDGDMLTTRVSKSSKEIGKGLFAQILKNQVKASKEYYGKVLSNKRNSSDDPDKRK